MTHAPWWLNYGWSCRCRPSDLFAVQSVKTKKILVPGPVEPVSWFRQRSENEADANAPGWPNSREWAMPIPVCLNKVAVLHHPRTPAQQYVTQSTNAQIDRRLPTTALPGILHTAQGLLSIAALNANRTTNMKQQNIKKIFCVVINDFYSYMLIHMTELSFK